MTDTPTAAPLLALRGVCKSYLSGSKRLDVLCHIDLTVAEGELLAIVGPSGCGKTTLLNCIAGLDRVDAGAVELAGVDVTRLDAAGWDAVRRDDIGFVFQFNNLLPEFSALENVMLPGLLGTGDRAALRAKARDLLSLMDMGAREDHLPTQLSGGEQQRVAIARALINGPRLLLADEPTGSLDAASGQRVFNLLRDLQKDLKISCLVVTHNPVLADLCARIHKLERSGFPTADADTGAGAGYV